MTDVRARSLRIGMTQWRIFSRVEDNLAAAERLIADAAASGAQLVVLPENALKLGTNQEMRAAAVELGGAELRRLGDAARLARVPVVLGGVKRHVPGQNLVSNTALVLGADGTVTGGYDKIHLFDATVAGQTFAASSVEVAGERPVLLDCGGALVGLTICFDIRFPELYRTLAQAGAEVLLVPAAFIERTGAAHWEVLLRARAIENQAFVIAPATLSGANDEGSHSFPTYGHAMAVSPWGTVLADLGVAPEAFQVVELDLDEVTRTREAMPILHKSRPDAYAAPPLVLTVS